MVASVNSIHEFEPSLLISVSLTVAFLDVMSGGRRVEKVCLILDCRFWVLENVKKKWNAGGMSAVS